MLDLDELKLDKNSLQARFLLIVVQCNFLRYGVSVSNPPSQNLENKFEDTHFNNDNDTLTISVPNDIAPIILLDILRFAKRAHWDSYEPDERHYKIVDNKLYIRFWWD